MIFVKVSKCIFMSLVILQSKSESKESNMAKILPTLPQKCVRLSDFPLATCSYINDTKLMFPLSSKQLRDMRHENLNLFLGLFFDSNIFGVVTEHCSRGSLEDLLNNEEVRLDWMFKSSLLMDLIRVRETKQTTLFLLLILSCFSITHIFISNYYQGMKYLHHRDIIHGRLKSRNCVVDGRFVLKVTDYGLNEILISQSLDTEEEKPEGEFLCTHRLFQ